MSAAGQNSLQRGGLLPDIESVCANGHRSVGSLCKSEPRVLAGSYEADNVGIYRRASAPLSDLKFT